MFSVICSKCKIKMAWYATGRNSGYWKCSKCPRTVGGVGHESQHRASCPFCNHRFDAHTPVKEGRAVPVQGDVTVCIECGNVLLFDGKGLRPMSIDEIERLPNETMSELVLVQEAVWKVRG